MDLFQATQAPDDDSVGHTSQGGHLAHDRRYFGEKAGTFVSHDRCLVGGESCGQALFLPISVFPAHKLEQPGFGTGNADVKQQR